MATPKKQVSIVLKGSVQLAPNSKPLNGVQVVDKAVADALIKDGLAELSKDDKS